MQLVIRAHFDKGYIADPYWPERQQVIDIQKASGLNRVRSEAKRQQVLRDYLATIGMTVEQYHQLERLAERPFHRRDGSEEIIIPAHQVHGCLAQAGSSCSSSISIARPEQIRTVLESSDWATRKTQEDGTWRRYVVVKSGSGKALTNQRALRSNPYIADFDAEGQLDFAGDKAQLDKLREFLAWCGREIGVGASRGMGWGRWSLVELEQVAPAESAP